MNTIKQNIKMKIEDIFLYEPKPPFSVNLNIPENKLSDVFTKLKDIYIKGLIIQIKGGLDFSGNNTLEIDKVNQTHIETMKKHMLSFGIKTTLIKITRNDKDALFRYLLYDLEKEIPSLNFHITIDWRTQHIIKLDFQLPKENKEDIVKSVDKITLKHNVANIFLKITKATRLKDFGIIIKKKDDLDDVTVIYFDFANIADYQKIHKCMRDKIHR